MTATERPRLRLFVPDALAEGGQIALAKPQAHYLGAVMRAAPGEAVLVFNGRDGEWRARIAQLTKAAAVLAVEARTRPQAPEPDLWLLAAPIKRDRIDLVAEKASELGASLLWPVFTRRTVMSRVNEERLAAHLLEAAEQCERLTVPELKSPVALDKALADWDERRPLLFLDESGEGPPLAEALAGIASGAPLALLVGPEGGFAPEERRLLAARSFTRPVSLGPRVLRAETAAIVALAVVQAVVGDWGRRPRQS